MLDNTPQTIGGATIDPPAADVAQRARERRDALLLRLAEEQALRAEKKAQLDMMLAENEADIALTKPLVMAIPIL